MKTLTTIGIVAGAAAVVVAAVIMAKKYNCSMSDADDVSDNIKGRLGSIKRKAKKEFRNMKDEADNNPAVDRVNKWVNSTL